MSPKAASSSANRLIRETSPYLLQHAHNPVEWYAWGEEAFDAARKQDRPIFLSIGYSTCYWCHVMERESFENEAIAQIMNEHFICIKVDREERPDVDDVYMTATQLMTQHGGWPMSVWLEPGELKPFYAGTYFPPGRRADRMGMPAFPDVLMQIARAWREQRDVVMQQAKQVADAVVKVMESAQGAGRGSAAQYHGTQVSAEYVDRAIEMLMRGYDPENAGFSGASGGGPKFPTPVNLDLLINAGWEREDVRAALLHTLDRMATGGMYDQIGGGFHRYSVDEKWLVPHFEKMLYDNAQLAATYARAFELTGDAFYAKVVRKTLEYVLREMTPGNEAGGFWSAQDAEVNAREGQNYLWTATEVRETLAGTTALRAVSPPGSESRGTDDLIDFVLEVYGFTGGTNFRDPHHPEDGPKNVVHLIDRPDRLAEARSMSLDEFNEKIETINLVLLKARDQRDQPGTDDKVLAAWNGLMIAGMADGGHVLGEAKYVEAAKRAAEFVLGSMRKDGGGLLRMYRKGEAKIDGFAEDYAFMIRGLLALHRATNDEMWVKEAECLAAAMRRRFFDEAGGGFFDTQAGQSDLFVRTKGVYDGAVPSANSVMLLNLIELAEVTGNDSYLDDATATLGALSTVTSQRPIMATLGVLGLARVLQRFPDRLKKVDPGERETAGEVVRVRVEPETISIHPDTESLVHIMMDIAEGYHINAHEPGGVGLSPLVIEVMGEGVDAQVLYPTGEPWRIDPSVRVHHGSIAVPVRIIASGDGQAGPRIAVGYQVCSETECLAPQQVVLPVNVAQ